MPTVPDKTAPTDHPVHPLIAERWSPRAFDGRPVDPAELDALFEAARWAASSGNSQPWRFVVATTDQAEDHARLAALLVEGNRRWAAAAPVLVCGVARLRDEKRELGHGRYDLGQAVATLLVQATALGLHVHQMAGFDAAAAQRELRIPDDCEAVVMFAVGHLGEPGTLPEDLEERERAPRVRRPAADFVFRGRFG